MTKYPLKAFLHICKMREEQAQRNLTKARAATQAAQEALQQAQENYEKHKKFRPLQEKNLFAQIQGQTISQKRLDDFHLEVKKLVEIELDLAKTVAQAQDHMQRMQKEEEHALTLWQESTKEHSKIQEHEKIWQEEQKKLLEKAEEAELERA